MIRLNLNYRADSRSRDSRPNHVAAFPLDPDPDPHVLTRLGAKGFIRETFLNIGNKLSQCDVPFNNLLTGITFKAFLTFSQKHVFKCTRRSSLLTNLTNTTDS